MAFKLLTAPRGRAPDEASVRISRAKNSAPVIRISREIIDESGIDMDSPVDLMIDAAVAPPRLAIVSGGSTSTVRGADGARTLTVTSKALAPLVGEMESTVVGHVVEKIDGRPAVVITLPEQAAETAQAAE